MSNQEEYRFWGRDPLSAEIDSQIKAMPDRPSVILAIIRSNKTPEEARFRELGPFVAHFMRELPYIIYGAKMVVTLFGFENEDGLAFMGTVRALAAMNIDEAIILENGKAPLKIAKLIQSSPAPNPSEFD